MKTRILILALCGALAFGTAVAQNGAATSNTTAQAQPKKGALLHLENPHYDFGEISRKGDDVTHDFIFTNTGTVPLVVTRILTSCSCIKASYPKRPVKPGDKGTITITYEARKSELGVFNKVLQVYSNSTAGRDVITVQGRTVDK